jgi:hypothetical protein
MQESAAGWSQAQNAPKQFASSQGLVLTRYFGGVGTFVRIDLLLNGTPLDPTYPRSFSLSFFSLPKNVNASERSI